MYASAARMGAADVDMLVDYAQVRLLPAMNLCADLLPQVSCLTFWRACT